MITLPAVVPMASCRYFLDHMQNEVATVIEGARRKGTLACVMLERVVLVWASVSGATSQRKIPMPSCVRATHARDDVRR